MNIISIAKKINENGGKLYYVGGYLRDEFLGLPHKDIDFSVTGISTDKFLELFPRAFINGSFFPVFKLEDYDFALARRETKIGEGHSAFDFDIENVSIYDDLARRDITINSIAKDVLTGEIIDPFNGVNDIKNKIIRATSTHFSEDPLRIYRVAQFATRFDFKIDDNLKNTMKSMKNELSTLSAERVFSELKKALGAEKPSIFFNILKELDLLDVHFKEIYNLIGVIQPIEYHPEGDAYNHSLLVLDKVSKLTEDRKTRFSALIHDLGKAKTPKEILPHHYKHELNGLNPARKLLNRLKAPNSWKKLSTVIIKNHMKAGIFEKMSIPKKVTFIEENYKYLKELELIAIADTTSNYIELFFETGEKMINEINGKTIKLPNDPKAKNILHQKRIDWFKNCQDSHNNCIYPE